MVVDLQELARRMLADYDASTPGRLFAEPLDLTTVQAYALQAEIARLREERGEHVIGYKVGCTSGAIQTQLGVREPVFGRLFDTECHPSGVHLPSGHFANLAVEGELAVRLGKDLSSQAVSEEECRGAIESVFPVIELHHFVLHSASSHGVQLIASGGMHAGFVLAEALPSGPASASESTRPWSGPWKMPSRSPARSNRCVGWPAALRSSTYSFARVR
jgi:2-keto-4-pentenoate hydratase